MKQLQFFALKEDILPVLETIEAVRPLQYVRTGNQTTADFSRFTHAASLPGLGHADRETGSTCSSYLIADRQASLVTRKLKGVHGETRFCMDQLANPDTVVFTHAGRWDDRTILQGAMGTASDTDASVRLMRHLEKTIKQTFQRVSARLVGARALECLALGQRLTLAVQSPAEFDFPRG